MSKPIELTKASVVYRIRHGANPTLKETIIRTIQGKEKDIEVVALKDISFSLDDGEVLAVVGNNGAGKSTLLKLLARVIPPSAGRVRIKGSIAPMIELGAGFNGELTGRENIILYGTLLGRRPSELADKANEIASWAGLIDSIDLPLRTFSSGMIARLAFSIATDQFSDITLVDEILSVGDADFQRKSRKRLKDLFESKSTVILVTHDTKAIKSLASKVLWIERGEIRDLGEVDKVLKKYLNA